MLPRQHSIPKYFHWFRNILGVFAFVYPLYILLTTILGTPPNNRFTEISTALFSFLFLFLMMMWILVISYFLQDIWVDEEGLLVEFLWRKIRVRWVDVIETKIAWGFLGSEQNRPLIVLVNGLTPFHRIFGVLYGLSIKPGFVISVSNSEYQVLKKTIQGHVRR